MLETDEKATEVREIVSSKYLPYGAWFGLTDIAEEGTYVWDKTGDKNLLSPKWDVNNELGVMELSGHKPDILSFQGRLFTAWLPLGTFHNVHKLQLVVKK